jgi:hypothetical protein
MRNSQRELWWSLAGVQAVTGIYAAGVNAWGQWPVSSGLFGHLMGVVGFLMMLSTETLYSLRKRSRAARWGKMSTWLQIHIFTGIVGSYMVVLHSAWRFQGLAGVLTLLTVVIVLSGFVGRYIYTSVPRSADGVALEMEEIQREVSTLEKSISLAHKSTLQGSLQTAAVFSGAGAGSEIPTRPIQSRKRSQAVSRQWKNKLHQLERRRDTLNRQLKSLAAARRMLSVWHSVHIPIGVALFTLAFFHIGAALYYATLSR